MSKVSGSVRRQIIHAEYFTTDKTPHTDVVGNTVRKSAIFTLECGHRVTKKPSMFPPTGIIMCTQCSEPHKELVK